MQPHIEVEKCLTDGHLLLDVNASDKHTVVAATRIRISREGPICCDLEFTLESDAQLEFRVSKEGLLAFKHSGVTLRALDGRARPWLAPLPARDRRGRIVGEKRL